MSNRPLCFVLMPFGKKVAGGTHPIDFDLVYREVIKPAVEEAGLEPLRADEEETGGIIHKPMFERLVLCDYAVADLTAANANVFYELGVRHAAKARSTVLLYAEGHGRLPFDVAQLRALPYEIEVNGTPSANEKVKRLLTNQLVAAKVGSDKDSPLYQLLEDYPDIAHEKTDVFRSRLRYAAGVKSRLAEARQVAMDVGRNAGRDAVHAVEQTLGLLVDQEAGVVIDLFLSYRAAEAWEDMERVQALMNPIVGGTVLVREQLALALNRKGDGQKAEGILKALIDERGPSSETYGNLGRVYKDRWRTAVENGQSLRAKGILRQVVDTYRKGFEADWRDAYPGVNAVTFGHILNPDDEETKALRPVVHYAVERKIENGDPDYWDYATLMELALTANEPEQAKAALADALGRMREPWEPKTTLNNVGIIRQSLPEGHPALSWIGEIEAELREAGGEDNA